MKVRVEIRETTVAVAVIEVDDEMPEDEGNASERLDLAVARRDTSNDDEYEVIEREITILETVTDNE